MKINKHSVEEVKKGLDQLVSNSQKLAYLLDCLESGEYELIMLTGDFYRKLNIKEIESILNKL